VVASLASFDDLTDLGADLFAIDVASGQRRAITPGDAWYDAPACSPDGRTVACIRVSKGSPDQAEFAALWEVEIATGIGRPLAPTFDLWPSSPVWAADGSAVYFLADRDGHGAAFRAEVATGDVTCLANEGTLGELVAAPDGEALYGLRSTLRTTPEVVRLAAAGGDQTPAPVASPAADADRVGAPGVTIRIEGHAPDGTRIGGWLVLPPEASTDTPVPLLVLVHGGPLGSWTDGWHWRWNPQLFAARGYAALMPDPGFSTGYGREFIQRGWGRWDRVYDDVIAVVDAAAARPEIDAGRTALLGGSFGGYMANWVAGHTDRFRAIVTHASLWELRGFHGTTDTGAWWEAEFGNPYRDPGRYLEQSPSAHVAEIRTPMLVIHGERDQRVPISEALRLWTDLQRHGVPSKFLYYPDENHWILKPQNARLWYGTVLAFLDQHVLDRPWERPALL